VCLVLCCVAVLWLSWAFIGLVGGRWVEASKLGVCGSAAGGGVSDVDG